MRDTTDTTPQHTAEPDLQLTRGTLIRRSRPVRDLSIRGLSVHGHRLPWRENSSPGEDEEPPRNPLANVMSAASSWRFLEISPVPFFELAVLRLNPEMTRELPENHQSDVVGPSTHLE